MPLQQTTISFADLNYSIFGRSNTTQMSLTEFASSNLNSLTAGVWPPSQTAMISLDNFTYNFSGSEPYGKITANNVTTRTSYQAGYYVAASWDGTVLAHTSISDGYWGKVIVSNKTGTNAWTANTAIFPDDISSPWQTPYFGYSVSLSSDGKTMAVGSTYDGKTDNGSVGATRIYVRNADGSWSKQATLVGTGYATTSDVFQGWSVSLSDDGNTLAVGGRGDNTSIGAVWVFTRSGSTWSQQGSKIVPTGYTGIYPCIGTAVALTPDGNTLVTSANNDNNGKGALWVFTRSGSTWTQQTILKDATLVNSFNYLGTSVSISRDGNTIAASSKDTTSKTSIFVKSGGTWSYQTTLNPTQVGNSFGQYQYGTANLSADGNKLIMSNPYDNSVGAVYYFTRSGSTWTARGKYVNSGTGIYDTYRGAMTVNDEFITAGQGLNNSVYVMGATTLTAAANVNTSALASTASNQGYDVATSANGTVVILSSQNDENLSHANSSSFGAAWVYKLINGVWTQQAKIQPANATHPNIAGFSYVYFGSSVSMSADGGIVAIGARGDGTQNGATYIYTTDGTNWTQQAKLIGTGGVSGGGNGGTIGQGSSVSLNSDATTVAIGGSSDNNDVGAIWVFTRSGSSWTQQGSKITPASYSGTNISYGSSISLSSDGNTLATGGYFDNIGVGAVWVYTRSGSTWTQQTKLVPSGYSGQPYFGIDCALSADGNTIVVGAYNESTAGAVYIFTRSGSTWTQQARIVPTVYTKNYSYFGRSVAITADGNMIAVGQETQGSGPSGDGVDGVMTIYTRLGTTWTRKDGYFSSNLTPGAHMGYSAAMSKNGKFVFIGAVQDAYESGAVAVFK